LQLRTLFAHLWEVAPELEEKLRHISLTLEQGSLQDVSRDMSNSVHKIMSMEQKVSYFRCLNDKWLAALEQVRLLDGFQEFLHSSQLSTLQGATGNGPTVVLNASRASCVTLILASTGVQHIPLTDLDFTKLTTLVNLLCHTIAQHGRDTILFQPNHAHIENLVQQMSFISGTLQWLRQ
jgi:hypothetical protein